MSEVVAMDATLERMPALYLSHGAPPLADDPVWPGELAAWSADLPRPKAILMVSAHWEEAPLALGATETVPLVYDFWGFPEHYYRVRYGAPGAPQLAEAVRKLLRGPGTPVQDIPDRGLDHGAYVPLVEMFPGADIPVLQISMPTLDPRRLHGHRAQARPAARRGRPDRRQRLLHPQPRRPPPHRRRRAGLVRRVRRLGTPRPGGPGRRRPPRLRAQIPGRTPRAPPYGTLRPLFVTMGAADAAGDLDAERSVIDGFWMGLAKRSVQFG